MNHFYFWPSPYLHYLPQYSATRKTSLSFGERPLTSCPSFRIYLRENGYSQISPFVQSFITSSIIILKLTFNEIFPFRHTATFTSDFCYSRISPASRRWALLALPLSLWLPHHNPVGLFITDASIVAPKSSVRFAAITLSTSHFCWRFPPSHNTSLYYSCSNQKVSLSTKTENTVSLGALTRFIHRGKNRNSSNIDPNERFSLVGI